MPKNQHLPYSQIPQKRHGPNKEIKQREIQNVLHDAVLGDKLETASSLRQPKEGENNKVENIVKKAQKTYEEKMKKEIQCGAELPKLWIIE